MSGPGTLQLAWRSAEVIPLFLRVLFCKVHAGKGVDLDLDVISSFPGCVLQTGGL